MQHNMAWLWWALTTASRIPNIQAIYNPYNSPSPWPTGAILRSTTMSWNYNPHNPPSCAVDIEITILNQQSGELFSGDIELPHWELGTVLVDSVSSKQWQYEHPVEHISCISCVRCYSQYFCITVIGNAFLQPIQCYHNIVVTVSISYSQYSIVVI